MSEQELVKCSCCDKMLPVSNVELTFKRPEIIAELNEQERETRCEQLWEDGITLDDNRFFIRALIPLNIQDSEEDYCLGAWAEISANDYQMVLRDWENEAASPGKPINGKIANTIPYTRNTLGAQVNVIATGQSSRPNLYINDADCSLMEEQKVGISRHRAAEFTNSYRNQTRWSLVEEEEFDANTCECCGQKIRYMCGCIVNEMDDIEADYWLRIPEGHKGQFTIAVSIDNGGEPRVAVLLGEMLEDGLSYWIRDRKQSPWTDFGKYGAVMDREQVLADIYKKLFFDVVDKVAATDSRLLPHINRENETNR